MEFFVIPGKTYRTPNNDLNGRRSVAIQSVLNTEFHLIHAQQRASSPYWLSVASVNDTMASPPSAPRCQNEQTTPHLYMFWKELSINRHPTEWVHHE